MPGFSDHRLQKGILDAGQFSMVSPPEALTSRSDPGCQALKSQRLNSVLTSQAS